MLDSIFIKKNNGIFATDHRQRQSAHRGGHRCERTQSTVARRVDSAHIPFKIISCKHCNFHPHILIIIQLNVIVALRAVAITISHVTVNCADVVTPPLQQLIFIPQLMRQYS